MSGTRILSFFRRELKVKLLVNIETADPSSHILEEGKVTQESGETQMEREGKKLGGGVK